ncbi:MAG: ATP-grasp domain-containing protein [Syntrophaceae bacterium]|nr:ATP-grasp domain-containing protein [Syntrophaceae bacterium]
MRTLVLGLSTRAIAESAVRGGNNVITLDYFGDQDQRALVENYSLLRDYGLPFNAESLLKASSDLKFDSLVYTSNLENHPDLVGELASRAEVSGNGPEVLCRIRNWSIFREFCRESSIPHPVTLLPGEEKMASETFNWLLKPSHSGGGSGIRSWDGRRLKGPHILQAHVDGIPASAAFVSNGKRSVVIGLTGQLIGNRELGASGYSWCGNILPLPIEYAKSLWILEEVEKMAARITQHFGLKGVGGVDFIISRGADGQPCPFLVEVNPRYTASMELMEWAYGLNIYSLHMKALDGGLPEFLLSGHLNGPYFGKGIVFTRQSVSIGNTKDWLDMGRRDIPFPGEEINAGRPVCTVLAKGNTYHECLSNLLRNAASVRRETGDIMED